MRPGNFLLRNVRQTPVSPQFSALNFFTVEKNRDGITVGKNQMIDARLFFDDEGTSQLIVQALFFVGPKNHQITNKKDHS
ncbi:hypothetical protein GCM10027051_05720 [Niabella terrae]